MSSSISVLGNQDMIKLRNNLNYIPIQASEIKESLDSYRECLDFKTEFINKYHYNTSLSPETINKKNLINIQAKKWQDDLTYIYKTKLKKRANSIIEKLKEEGEAESSLYDSIILKNIIQKMKIDEISRRISLEAHRAKIQNFNIEKLKKKAEKEIALQKFKEQEKNSIWNKVQNFRRPTMPRGSIVAAAPIFEYTRINKN